MPKRPSKRDTSSVRSTSRGLYVVRLLRQRPRTVSELVELIRSSPYAPREIKGDGRDMVERILQSIRHSRLPLDRTPRSDGDRREVLYSLPPDCLDRVMPERDNLPHDED